MGLNNDSGSTRGSIPGWRRITRSGLAFLLGFSVPLPLGTAVRLYKDAFHRCFNSNLVIVVFSFTLLHCLQDFGEAFCYWSPTCPPHCANPLLVVWGCNGLGAAASGLSPVWSTHSPVLEDPTDNKCWLWCCDALRIGGSSVVLVTNLTGSYIKREINASTPGPHQTWNWWRNMLVRHQLHLASTNSLRACIGLCIDWCWRTG